MRIGFEEIEGDYGIGAEQGRETFGPPRGREWIPQVFAAARQRREAALAAAIPVDQTVRPIGTMVAAHCAELSGTK